MGWLTFEEWTVLGLSAKVAVGCAAAEIAALRKTDAAAPAKVKVKKAKTKKAGNESSGASLVTKVYVQSGSIEYDCSDIVERAREDYKKDH